MIRLIAIDLDGTLLHEDKSLSKRNIDLLHQAHRAGYTIVICTGRPLSGVKPIFEQIAFPPGDYFMIINNGCTTLSTQDWKILDHRELSLSDIESLQNLNTNPAIQLTIFDLDHYFVVNDPASDLVTTDAGLVNQVPQTIKLEEIPEYQPIFQAMYAGAAPKLDAFQKDVEVQLEREFNTVRSQDILFEVLPQGSSKASALQNLTEILGYTRENVMALGDANNDIEMLKFAGYSVAMGNANETVKELADFVTLTNDQDGVAYAIEKLISEQKGDTQ